MSKPSFIPVILSGGSGARLWPLSRADFPKQFCNIFGESLFVKTFRRLQTHGEPWVVSAQSMKVLTEAQIRKNFSVTETQWKNILYEPVGKNTAPAVALLLKTLLLRNIEKSVIGIFPADHLVQDQQSFDKAVSVAVNEAERGQIVTLGIKPTEPNTGYGYIQVREGRLNAPQPVVGFHEKPNLVKAADFIASGRYLWNSGVFFFRSDMMTEAFRKYQHEIWQGIEKLLPDYSNLAEVYEKLPSQSMDYGIMEKVPATSISCVPAEFGWSDVGSWDAIADLVGISPNPIINLESNRNFVHSNKQNKVYSFIGVDDAIVVDTDDATLVVKRKNSQKVKTVFDQLTTEKNPMAKVQSYDQRPWGEFEVLRDDKNFKAKVIRIEPGQQLSLQSHAKREEHWVVTKGTGEVVLNGKTVPVKAGTYVHVPVAVQHRMRNTGKTELQFIEVQLGEYFGEDDIVRYADDYQRA